MKIRTRTSCRESVVLRKPTFMIFRSLRCSAQSHVLMHAKRACVRLPTFMIFRSLMSSCTQNLLAYGGVHHHRYDTPQYVRGVVSWMCLQNLFTSSCIHVCMRALVCTFTGTGYPRLAIGGQLLKTWLLACPGSQVGQNMCACLCVYSMCLCVCEYIYIYVSLCVHMCVYLCVHMCVHCALLTNRSENRITPCDIINCRRYYSLLSKFSDRRSGAGS